MPVLAELAAEWAHSLGWDQGIGDSAEEAACRSFDCHSCRRPWTVGAETQASGQEVWERKRRQVDHRRSPSGVAKRSLTESRNGRGNWAEVEHMVLPWRNKGDVHWTGCSSDN